MTTYYHGTLDIFLDAIEREGLLASPEFRLLSTQLIPGRLARTDAIWVTDKESAGWKWAYQAAEHYEDEYGGPVRPVLLKIERLPDGCKVERDVLLDEGREIDVPHSYRIFGCNIPPEHLQVKSSPRSKYRPVRERRRAVPRSVNLQRRAVRVRQHLRRRA